MSQTTIRETADELVREAHRRVYRFPPGFPGFRAELAWATDDAEGTGHVVVRLGDELEIAIDGVEGQEWVSRELHSIVTHRAHRSYAAGDGALDKELVAAGPLGETVKLDDPMSSSYVVGDGRIALVTRTHAGERFTIAIQQRAVVDQRDVVDRHEVVDRLTELATAFTVAYWNEDAALLRAEAYADRYTDCADAVVPAARTVVTAATGGISVRRLELTGHVLIAAGGAR